MERSVLWLAIAKKGRKSYKKTMVDLKQVTGQETTRSALGEITTGT